MIIVDVSSNNPRPINWTALRLAGVDGAMIKATEGLTYTNPHFGEDYFAALNAGLVPGAYHFWHPELSVLDQLSFFRGHYGPRAGDLAPWWDSEINPTGRSWAELGADLRTAVWLLALTYHDALIYLPRSWAAELLTEGFGVRNFALAQGSPGPVMRARIMQMAPAPIPGVGGLTDWSVST